MVLNDTITFVLFIVLFFGMAALAVVVWRVRSHYNQLTKGIATKTLTQVLTETLGEIASLQKSASMHEQAIDALQREGEGHVQRIGIVRFNPFSDTGGAQSFTMAILDGNNTGVVLTSLYARTGNRWYVKPVIEGKGKDIELSKEELAAMKQARRES